MAKNTVVKAIQFLEQCLRKSGLNTLKIILFGSQATGKATKESDIDIVILSEDFNNKNLFERAKLTKDAEIMTIKKFQIPLDIMTLTPEEYENKTPSAVEYVRESRAIYRIK